MLKSTISTLRLSFVRCLKENVIIGKVIPAGTGMQRYADVQLESNSEAEIVENDDTDDVIVALEDDEIMDF